eukprot:gene18902-19851_t
MIKIASLWVFATVANAAPTQTGTASAPQAQSIATFKETINDNVTVVTDEVIEVMF